jgi:hypothetical protein
MMDQQAPVSRRSIKLAFTAYDGSVGKAQVHHQITQHVKEMTVLDRRDRDGALSKIVDLIRDHHITPEEIEVLKAQIGAFDFSKDEPWDVSG